MEILSLNELFLVVDRHPGTFLSSVRGCPYYMLTLILSDNEECMLILTPPCLCFSLDLREVRQIISICFSDFLVELFRKNTFSMLGALLRRAENGLLFSGDAALLLKEPFIRIKPEAGFDSGIQLLQMLKVLAESGHSTPLPENPGLATNEVLHATDRINKVWKYVSEHFRKPVKIEDVAREVGFSANGFSHFFKKKTGMNFSDYVNRVRIEEAVRLLRETDDTLAGIAYSCGFNTAHYFSEVFKRRKGMTPGRFREE